MSGLFNWNSPVIQFFNKIVDMIFLNILTLVFSIPIFTIGAAQAALYDVTGRMMRDEGTVWACFWKAFRSNFRQATGIWLVLAAVGAVVIYTFLVLILAQEITGTLAVLCVCIALLLWSATLVWSFPLQARFVNPVSATLRSALCCGLLHLPRTLVMVLANAIPWLLFLLSPTYFLGLTPLWALIWFSLVARFDMMLLKKPLSKLEEMATA